jgi:hypothetical protein
MTAAQLTYFPVTGRWYDVESPSLTGTTNLPQFLVVSAFVTFTPRIAPGTVEYITNLDLQMAIPAPVLVSATASTTGGTLAAGSYWYVVTATTANGETVASNQFGVATTGSTSSVVLPWLPVDGATGYKVYRGTSSGGENKLLTTTTALTYTDTGTAGTTATPPVTNTAELSANTALAIAPITARIYEGELQTINQAGTPGVSLLSNSTALGLSSLIYDVAFTQVVYASKIQNLTNFAFTAPTDTTPIDLASPTLTRLPYNPTAY